MKITNYIFQLGRLYHGGNWVQESFEGKLNGLSDGQAFQQPVPGIHSVAELLWHCMYWRHVNLKRLRGEKNTYRDATSAFLNFLTIEELKTKGWKTIRREFEQTQIQLIDFLKQQTDSFLENEYEPGHSYEFAIEGTIQHDYYHLGQIGLVIRLLKEARALPI